MATEQDARTQGMGIQLMRLGSTRKEVLQSLPGDGGEKARLLVRIRVSPEQTGFVSANLITLPHLIMQQKMLKGLRRRSEQTAREREAGTWQPAAATVPGTESPVSWQPPAHGA